MTTPTGSFSPVKLTQEDAWQVFNNVGVTVAQDTHLLNLEFYF